MNDDATALSTISHLDAKSAREAAAGLAIKNRDLSGQLATKEAENHELKNWVSANAPDLLNRGGRIVVSGVVGAATGAAFGTFDPVYALLGAGVTATAAGFATLLFKKPDAKDFMTCVSGGIVAGTAAIEGTKATKEFWAARAAKKAAAGAKTT